MITVRDDEQWLALRRVLGDPEWAVDESFGTVAQRRQPPSFSTATSPSGRESSRPAR